MPGNSVPKGKQTSTVSHSLHYKAGKDKIPRRTILERAQPVPRAFSLLALAVPWASLPAPMQDRAKGMVSLWAQPTSGCRLLLSTPFPCPLMGTMFSPWILTPVLALGMRTHRKAKGVVIPTHPSWLCSRAGNSLCIEICIHVTGIIEAAATFAAAEPLLGSRVLLASLLLHASMLFPGQLQ